MKLAEARNKIHEMTQRLDALRDRLQIVSLSNAAELLEEINSLSTERLKLQMQLATVEADTFIAGNSLRDLVYVLDSLDVRLETLSVLQGRKDLNNEVATSLFKQMDEFSKIKSNLKNSIDQAYWQVDLEV